MGGDKRVDSDRDSELELDYNHCELKTTFLADLYKQKFVFIFFEIYIETNISIFNSGQ